MPHNAFSLSATFCAGSRSLSTVNLTYWLVTPGMVWFARAAKASGLMSQELGNCQIGSPQIVRADAHTAGFADVAEK